MPDDSPGRRPIEGVPTGIAAFLGETERGSVRPRLITSYAEYRRWFGDVFGAGDRFLPYAANGFFENGGRSLYICRIAGAGATSASKVFGRFTVRAVGAGAWGNRVWAKIEKSTGEKPRSFRVKLAYWSADNATPFDPFAADPANRSKTQPTLVEDFDGLVLDPASPDYYGKRLLGSALATLTRAAGARASIPSFGESSLAGGADGPDPVGPRDFEGGLKALELDAYRDVALVHAPCPPLHPDAVARSLIAHCEKMKFRFAVVDCGKGAGDAAALDPRTTIADTPYAAFYFPWLRISDPLSGERRLVPPGGHVLGVFARTDNERGVFKAPANEVVRGAVDLERNIDDATQGVLTPSGVNAIRQFPGRGIRVWGARTLSSDGMWKYVNVRRLFIFLEHSIDLGTQWVAFEPSDESLWTRVKEDAGDFLRSQWRAGALPGRTEKEAFFVKCDGTTMTEDDIASGRLICEIGVAPLRPAEFVIFRVFQRTAPARR